MSKRGAPLDGTVVAFGTSGFVAKCLGESWDGLERAMLDVTPADAAAPGANEVGNKEFLPSDLVDGGTLTLRWLYDADQVPPIHGDPETITITRKLRTGETTPSIITGTGALQSVSNTVNKEETSESTLVIKWTEGVTITPAT